MQLKDALRLAQANTTIGGDPVRVHLACGFTPLHLPAFLTAHLSAASPGVRFEIVNGRYGDLCEAVEAIDPTRIDAGLVIVEYADLDPRFGLRRSGGWGREAIADAMRCAGPRLARLQAALATLVKRTVLVLPTLPLPPVSGTSRWQATAADLDLQASVAAFATAASRLPVVIVCNAGHLAELSPPEARRNVQAELVADFPYSLPHASAVAAAAAAALHPPQPLKGIITDLDDTLWRGLVGEVGPDAVSWSLDGSSQIHALYQQTLENLAEQGVMIGVASKNDPQVVAAGLAREDLLFASRHIFPVEAGWGQKSEAVRRILAAWNIGAESVAFIDDNPLEIEEVRANFPAIRTLTFPTRNDNEAFRLLGTLRDMAHRESLSQEDAIRVDSLRGARLAQAEAARAVSQDDFLETLDSRLEVRFGAPPGDARPLELINKTNQFNLNGHRLSQAQWDAVLAREDGFSAVLSYADKFGPLGRISVLFGRTEGDTLTVEGWVLSCRAFSRRIEFAALDALFQRFGASNIRLCYEPTDRNGPVRDFVALVAAEPQDDGSLLVERARYADAAPRTYCAVTLA